jgi:hypothetical protein
MRQWHTQGDQIISWKKVWTWSSERFTPLSWSTLSCKYFVNIRTKLKCMFKRDLFGYINYKFCTRAACWCRFEGIGESVIFPNRDGKCEQSPMGDICIDKSHLLPNNPARLKYLNSTPLYHSGSIGPAPTEFWSFFYLTVEELGRYEKNGPCYMAFLFDGFLKGEFLKLFLF